MLKLLQRFIQQEQLFVPQKDKILLALSGGQDSCLLVYLLHELGIKIGLAHCNFQLRGEESNRDQAFCEQLAAAYGLELHATRFDTAQYAQTHKLSTQEAARILRYTYFEQIRAANNYQFIATAHHLSDSIETVLLNLGKGCGIRGLHGILPKQNYIIRPLLFASQAEIRAYVAAKKIAFVEDSSNMADKYSRNFIRHHIVPKFKQLYPSFEPTFGENIQRFKQGEQLYNWALSYWAEKILFVIPKNIKTPVSTDTFGINNTEFLYKQNIENALKNNDFLVVNLEVLALAPAPNTLLYECLHKFGFNAQQTAEMADKNTQIGALWASVSHQVVKNKAHLYLQPLAEKQITNKDLFVVNSWADFPLILSPFETLKIEFSAKPTSTTARRVVLDSSMLAFPLHIRRTRAGDRFAPKGMEGKTKKINDFLKDMGIKAAEKDKIWLLETNHQIAAVLDLRANHFFVGDDTKPEQIITCYIEKNNFI